MGKIVHVVLITRETVARKEPASVVNLVKVRTHVVQQVCVCSVGTVCVVFSL